MIRTIFLFILTLVFLTAEAQDERNFQIWNFNSVSVNVAGRTRIYASEKVHYTPAESSFNLKFGDVWLKHETSKWFEYAGGFRVLYSRNEADWVEEQRPMIMGTFMKKILDFSLDFSHRMEYRMYKHNKDHFRYRQNLYVQSPALTSFGLKLFASEETYTKFTNDKTHLARLYTGIKTFNNEHFTMKLYYVLEKNKKERIWYTADIIGMNLSFQL